MDIFNVDENMKEFINEDNSQELLVIIEEFKRGHFINVLAKTKAFREKYEIHSGFNKSLWLVEVTCYTQIGESTKAAIMIKGMYEQSNEKSIDDLILYGNLAYMCDYKLTRRIMSDAVKRIEKEVEIDKMQAAHAYLVLGEAEEKLEKYVRAIKYYKQGLSYIEKNKDEDKVLFLHFKLGALHSLLNEIDVAIEHLQIVIEQASEKNMELKINSHVSIAKMYGSKKEYEKATSYLNEAIPLLEDSSLAKSLVHAETYTEMAFNYFDQSKLEEAVPYYEQAISLHRNLPRYSAREVGMIYMQYAYCLENQKRPSNAYAGRNYELAIEQLEKANDPDLLESAFVDVIAFFERIGNSRKKRFYENKYVVMVNEKNVANVR